MVDLAIRMLLHDKLRFAITVAGVVFAVALVLLQTGLFLGAMDNASIVIDNAEADLWVTSLYATNVDFAPVFPDAIVNRVRATPGVARADNLLVSFVTITLPTGAQELVEVYAMEDFRGWRLPWNVVEGNVADLRRGPYFLLDESSRKRFGDFAVGEFRQLVGRRMEVVGRTREAFSFTTTPIAFMSLPFLRSLWSHQLDESTHYVLVRLAPGADIERVRAELRRKLPYNDVLTRAEWAERSRAYWIEKTGLGLNMFITVLLGALVGVVIVAQTLYGATMEHLREFGTVKAIGGSNSDIYIILAKQAAIAAVIGFVAAELPTWALRPVLATVGLKSVVPMHIHILTFVGTVVLCLVAATIPFRKISRIDPALVFRS
ncbi:MAG TPA: ABC transporter permease [Gemmatimonadaceae bacterium]|nr:ABC transporter permease [Gemmatimonadaceae bacterium]